MSLVNTVLLLPPHAHLVSRATIVVHVGRNANLVLLANTIRLQPVAHVCPVVLVNSSLKRLNGHVLHVRMDMSRVKAVLLVECVVWGSML